MTGRLEVWLYVAQRGSAFVLAPLVIVHLATMIYAIQGGLSAEEILSGPREARFGEPYTASSWLPRPCMRRSASDRSSEK